MSDLAFLSSEDEAELENTKNNKDVSSTSVDNAGDTESGSDSDESSAEEFGNDFEFGGLLGEDGGQQSISNLLSSSGKNEWSYKAALKILENNDSNGTRPERTNVASIIAAARQNLKKDELESENMGDDNVSGENSDSSSNAEDDGDDSDSGNDDDDDDSSSSGDESSDDEVDDVQKAKEMDQDVLRERHVQRKETKTLQNDNGSDDEEADEDDNDGQESSDDEDEETRIEAAKAAKFFDSKMSSITKESKSVNQVQTQLFVELNLSRPLLRGVASIGFVSPTPIQSRVIPIALSGRDVCASAQTGSGKSAAFLLPVMERILQRGGGKVQLKSRKQQTPSATRGLVLTPTRELAAQCLGMMTAMAKFTDLRAVLIVGGAKNVNAQAAELRTRPDVIVATPGRLLDHLTNSTGMDLDDLEFLILDEADRLLDLGFQDEVHEIIKACPAERQTLLFSATMGTKVDDLIKLSLKRPLRIHVSTKNDANGGNSGEVEVANRLQQEFVRVRASNEGINREAMLLALLTRTFTSRTIVFFDTKVDAHRLMIICGLCGIKCAELHGNLTQVQRLEALENFREGSVDVLLATDLAARGLDISSVEAVVNFEMPGQVESYVHRIGRTARAGRAGKACTLIGEGRRQLMKAVMKDAEQKRRMEESKAKKGKSKGLAATGVIRSRTIPTAVLKHFAAKIISLDPHIKDVYAAEAVARMDRIAEMEANKAQNLIRHGDDIRSRPQREWFASNKDKVSAKERYLQKQEEIKAKVGTGVHRMTRKKRRMREAKAEIDAMQEEAMELYEETGQQSKKIMTQNAMKSTAKSFKRDLQEKQQLRDTKSLHEEDIERKQKRKKLKITKKRKGVFATDALGDSDLFGDEAVAYAAKPEKVTVAKSSYEFTDYDPNKPVRKNKAKGHHGFKSKSKYNRRK